MSEPLPDKALQASIAELAEMIERLPPEREAQLMRELETQEGENNDGSLPAQ